MKDEYVFAFISFLIIGVMLGAFLTVILYMHKIGETEKENKELKTEKYKLEQKLLKLYDEQAEQTKKIAELNGIGG